MPSQAVKDLPDPLDTSPTTASANPDDLLSQMADEAIDKLMAEAERDDPTPRRAPIAPAPEAEKPASEPTAVPAQIEATLAAALDRPLEPVVPAVESSPESIDSDMPSYAIDSGPAAADDASLLAAAGVGSPSQADDAPPPPAADIKALLAEPDHGDGSPSILLLPLRIINAPFSILGDTVRNAVGQVAIVTLINAVAVLAYVLIFRRHH